MEQFWTFFAFPLNILLAVLWTVCLVWLWKNHSSGRIVRFMLSPAATVSALTLLAGACLWIGLSGDRGFVQSVFFVALLLYVQTVVFLVVLRGWRRADGVVRWRFLLIHLGLLLALGAGYWGSPDSSEMRVVLSSGESSMKVYRPDGSAVGLGYELRLQDYDAEVSDEGKPVHYEAVVSVDSDKPVRVTVNHPYGVRFGEDIYLASVSENGCVFQIVREPWRWFALAGIIMMLVGAFMLFIKGPRR